MTKSRLALFIFLLIAGLFSLQAADNGRNVRVPLPDQEPPRITTIMEPPTIDIALIEKSASEEAERTKKDYDILVLQRLLSLVNRYISGDLYMNEQDIILIEIFLERRGNVSTAKR